jgi:hypothetical protein
MKPSLNHQYHVKDLQFDNITIFIVRFKDSYLSSNDVASLKVVNKTYFTMISEVQCLQSLDFSTLKKPRHDYATQEHISQDQVVLATACLIHYGLHPGMMIQYLKGEYVGENRDTKRIIREGKPFISEIDATHILQVLTQGCPSCLIFDEEIENKLSVILKGN